MKRKILVLLLMCLIVIMLVGCDNNEHKQKTGKALKVGFLFVGPIGDGGWNYAHNKGLLEIEEMPYIQEILYRENASNTESSLIAIEELIKDGADLIFATSYNHKEATLQMAKKYPKVIFESCSTFLKEDNIGSYFGKIYQGWYLAGILAGMKTESNKIGIIVAHANPECRRITNAFSLGIKAMNPQAQVYVEWIHSWYNPVRENAIANKMIDMGCDIIAHNSDSNESQKVADNRNVYSIGYNTDMKTFAPRKNLVSVVWNWGDFYKEKVEEVYEGRWVASKIWLDLDSGLFGLTEFGDHFDQSQKSILQEIIRKVKAKELVIFSGPIKDNEGNDRVLPGQSLTDEELLTIDWLVDNISVINPIATE